jgi:hypothetical protein
MGKDDSGAFTVGKEAKRGIYSCGRMIGKLQLGKKDWENNSWERRIEVFTVGEDG